jgi:hypothetical protein
VPSPSPVPEPFDNYCELLCTYDMSDSRYAWLVEGVDEE